MQNIALTHAVHSQTQIHTTHQIFLSYKAVAVLK